MDPTPVAVDPLKHSLVQSVGSAPGDMASIANMSAKTAKKNSRSQIWDRWFRFLLQQYKADEFLSIGLAKTYLTFYFVITTISITDFQGIDNFYVGYKLDSTSDLVIRLCILAFLLTTLATFGWGFLLEEKISSAPSLITFVGCHLRYTNTYLIFPSCIWLYSKDAIVPDETAKTNGTNVFSWIHLILSFVTYLTSIFMRSHLPTRGKLNTPYRISECATYLVITILVILTRISTQATFKLTIQTISMTLSCLVMAVAWFMQTFWWKSINNFYLIGFVCMNSFRIVIRVLQDVNQKPNFMEYIAFIAIFTVVFGRFAYNLSSHRLIQRIEQSARTSNIDNYMLFFSYDLCREADEAEMSGRLPRGLLFYLSQTGRDSSRRELAARQRIRDHKTLDNPYMRYTEDGSLIDQGMRGSQIQTDHKMSIHDPMWAYYRRLSVSKPTSADEVFVFLLLQLIFLNKNLMMISPTLLMYKKTLGSQAKSSLNLFIVESLLQGRLENLSRSDEHNSEETVRPTLSQIVSEITRDLDSTMSTEAMFYSKLRFTSNKLKKSTTDNTSIVLDLTKVLVTKSEFLEAMCKVNKLIDVKTDIFTMLFEKYVHKSSILYHKNGSARTVALQIDNLFNNLVQNELTPSYILACALSYYLKIRFDIQKTEKIFKVYQTKLSRYHALSLNPVKEITEQNFQYSSVVAKINIAQELTLGMIADISPNYSDYLGTAENADPTRVNINSLFPGKMSETHIKMMKATSDQPIFNMQKDFQLNGFDGILKPLRFILKLDSSVATGLHCMALLKFPTSKQKTLLLVDDKLQVVSAEQEFWQTLEAFRGLASIEKLGTLSDTLTLQIALMKFLVSTEEKVLFADNESNTEPGHSASDYDASRGKIQENNGEEGGSSAVGSGSQEFSYQRLKHRVLENFNTYENTGILHTVSDEMRLPPGLAGLPFLANIEQAPFGREKYYRIWVTFDLNYNKEARNIKLIARSPRASQYNLTMTGDPFAGKPQTVVNNKLSDSDNNAAGDVADTAGSVPGGLKMGAGHKEIAPDTFSFEHILMKLKKTSPIVALISEASQRNYPPEIKAALNWIQEFYKASEAAGEKNFLAQLERARTGKSLQLSHYLDHHKGDGLRNTGADKPQRNMDALRLNTLLIEQPVAFLTSGIEKKFIRDPKNQVMPRQRNEKFEAKFLTNQVEHVKTDVRIIPIGKESTQSQASVKIEWPDSKNPQSTGTFGKSKSWLLGKNSKVSKIHPGFQTLGSDKKTQTVVKFIGSDGEEKKPAEEYQEHSGTEHKSTVFSQVLRKLFKYRNSRYLAGRDEKDSRVQKKDELDPLVLQAASQQNHMIALNEHNVQLVNRYLSDFKLVRRAEHQPDAEKNASLSSKSTASKGSHFIKVVNSTIQTKKKGDVLYWFTVSMLFFAVYFGVMFQVVSNTLNVYNISNRNNFLILSDFILIDRILLQGVENQAYLYDHVSAATNATLNNTIERSFNTSLPNGTVSYEILSGRLSDVTVDLKDTLDSILLKFTSLIDPKDSPDVAKAIYRQEEIQIVEEDGRISYVDVDFRGWILYFVQKFGDSLTTLTAINDKVQASNITYKFSPKDVEDLEIVRRTKYGSDRTVWNKTLARMGPVLTQIVDSIILSAVDRHFSKAYMIIYISIAVSVIMIVCNSFVSWKINQVQKEYLENYNLVRPWELFLMIDELGKQKTLFTQSLFHEMVQMSMYLEGTLHTQVQSVGQKALLLEEQYAKDKEKSTTNYKFSHNFTFFTSKFTFCISFCGLLIYGLIGLTVYTFLSVNERRIGVERLLFDSHKYLLDVTKYYLSGTVVAMYGYHLPLAETNVDDEVFVNAADKYNIYQNQKRGEFLSFFGQEMAYIIDDITFGDICSYIDKYPDLNKRFSEYRSLCLSLNAES